MKKRLSVAIEMVRDASATGALKDVTRIDVRPRNLIKPTTS
ncbi:hypothetical protein [Bradyrhizobium sp. RP6]|nr:hypothetical protein [Bradyrhizobium sp. RP6]